VNDDLLGQYRVLPFPLSRKPGVDVFVTSRLKHHVPVLLEVDVTAARKAVARRREESGEAPSFTGWIISCLAAAVSEHPRLHAMRRGRRRLVVFDDVDVTVLVNREIEVGGSSTEVPLPCLIRRAQEKTLEEIHAEIREAQSRPLGPGDQVPDSEGKAPPLWAARLFFALPWFLRRRLVWNGLVRDPFRAKRTTGTVVVTAIGMYGGIAAGGTWFVPLSTVPLVLAVGGIARKPRFVDGALEERELLSLTVLFDHDVVDGAPVFAFVERLRELMEGQFGL
jgi:pyruvate/2-oxoglutarate dehydrogenase complex dihydrolipoamide acyltransferase (E2) component